MTRPRRDDIRPLIWMSRTLPVAQTSADKLAKLGYAVLVAPLLRMEPLAAPLDLQGVGSLIFTSRNGVAAFARRTAKREFLVFTVGDGTAAAARQAGFPDVLSADGDVDDLRKLLLAKARREDGVILRAGAEEPAGALVADLAWNGFDVWDWPAYRTVEANPREVVHQIRATERIVEAALLYSPKAARSLSRILEKQRIPLQALICLSPAVAAELVAHVSYPIRVAARPTETSLWAAMQTESD